MMIHLSFYVPSSHKEQVKEAVFAAGAGKIGHYDRCCWETDGLGQYRPLLGSRPYLGQQNLIEKVEEVKVEMVLSDTHLNEVLQALLKAHPYETPAFYALPCLDLEGVKPTV